ncbi:hypothetical protein HB016_004983 [Salmonella enterica subsp. enterica]|nr:hypothetical protein [Salmonella enterica subsp. enterica serovar Poano]
MIDLQDGAVGRWPADGLGTSRQVALFRGGLTKPVVKIQEFFPDFFSKFLMVYLLLFAVIQKGDNGFNSSLNGIFLSE